MKNKSVVVCPNCKSENPYYNNNCFYCNFFLRNKIPNINLGEIILSIIESPEIAFEIIILSVHKNYVFILLFFLSFRFLILSRFISVPFLRQDSDFSLLLVVGYFLLFSSLIIYILVFITSLFIRKLKIYYRKSDIFAVIVYTFLPSIFALFLLYPIELTIYGKYLFSNNPFPYNIKENVFYFLIVFELLLIFWSFLLHIKGMLALKLNLKYSIIVSLFNYSILIVFLFLSKNIFI